MTSFRENLIDRMIRIYGYESKITINFCRICETWEDNSWNNKCLSIMVQSHEAAPVFLEEE